MILKIRDALKGDHVHVDFFVGPDADHLALAGTLVFRNGEWMSLQLLLALGAVHQDTTGCAVLGSAAFNAAVEAMARAVKSGVAQLTRLKIWTDSPF